MNEQRMGQRRAIESLRKLGLRIPDAVAGSALEPNNLPVVVVKPGKRQTNRTVLCWSDMTAQERRTRCKKIRLSY